MTDLDHSLAHRKLQRQLRASLAKEAAESSRIRELRFYRDAFERRLSS